MCISLMGTKFAYFQLIIFILGIDKSGFEN